jgi:hypothetical protein
MCELTTLMPNSRQGPVTYSTATINLNQVIHGSVCKCFRFVQIEVVTDVYDSWTG